MSFKKIHLHTGRSQTGGSRGHSTGFGSRDTFLHLFHFSFPFICKTRFCLVRCLCGSKASFVCFTYQSAAPSYQAVIWLENSFGDFHVFYFNARVHKRHQRRNQPLRCTYIKLNSGLKVNYFRLKKLQISRWKGNREARFSGSSLSVPPRPPPSSLNSLPPRSLLWSDESGIWGHVIAFLTLQKLGTWRSPLPGTQATL